MTTDPELYNTAVTLTGSAHKSRSGTEAELLSRQSETSSLHPISVRDRRADVNVG